MSEQWVTVARLVKARGIKGEIAADTLTSHAGRFETIRSVTLFRPDRDEPGRALELENSWEHGDLVILKFSGIDTMSDAETLVGMDVRIPISERSAPPEGEYYQTDLVGCEAVERDGRRVGKVVGFENYGGPDLLVVKADDGEMMVPFVKAICVEIDVPGRRITMELPEGLRELARG